MNARRPVRRLRTRLILPVVVGALLLGMLVPPRAALAHPADVYLQSTYLTVAPTSIVVELVLTPGVLVAAEALAHLDADRDGQISESEGQAYVDAVLDEIVLQVDGTPLELTVTETTVPTYLNVQAGYGELRVTAVAPLAERLTGTHQLAYTNNFAPIGTSYQVNTFVEPGAAITLGKQNRDSIQQSMTVDFTLESPLPESTTPFTTTSTVSTMFPVVPPVDTTIGTSAQAQQLLPYLYEPTHSPWVLVAALGIAIVLGGLHALTPGHGKTLVAAYLVGSRGTVGHAIALGAIVTFTHTASVIVIGLLALFASQFIVPDVLVPLLETLSGLLVVLMGTRLVWERWVAFRARHHSTALAHDHPMDTETNPYLHDHGDGHVHSHLPPTEGIRMGSLAAMGVSGGIVPCPEALGIMVIAVGLNRILFGLGLIISFSFGLAAVLIGIGILLVRSRTLVERVGGMGGRLGNALPLLSAVIVTMLGVGITLTGVASYLR